MASTDAKPIPQKNAAFRITFDILDADGDPVTGAAGLDSEKSIDAAGFSDCTNESTEIGNGVYYLDLTAAEMNGDTIAITVKTSTAGAKQTNLVIYPKEAGDMSVTLEDGAITANAIAANAITDAKINAGAITAAKFASGAIDATAFAQGAADKVWSSAARTLTSFGTLIADIWANTSRTLSSFGTLVADIWANTSRTITDKTGFSISGVKQTLDALNDITASSVWAVGTRSLTDKAGFTISGAKQTLDSLNDITAASVWAVSVRAITDKAGFSISGTKQTLDALNDITAASIWSVVSRTLTAAVDINSNSDITAIKAKTDLITGAPALETTAQSIKSKTDLIPAVPATEGTSNAIKAKTDLITGSVALEASVQSVQTTVDGISNVTRISTSLPDYFTRPDSGDKAIFVKVTLKDNDGAMQDPDSNELGLKVYNSSGTSRNAKLYKEYALTNALDDASGLSGYKKMEREATGIYYYYYKVEDSAAEEELIFDISWKENTIVLVEFKYSQVVDATNDMNAIKAKTDKLTFDADNNIIADSRKISASATASDNVEAVFTGAGDSANVDLSARSLLLKSNLTGKTPLKLQNQSLGGNHVIDLVQEASGYNGLNMTITGAGKSINLPSANRLNFGGIDIKDYVDIEGNASGLPAVRIRALASNSEEGILIQGKDDHAGAKISGSIALYLNGALRGLKATSSSDNSIAAEFKGNGEESLDITGNISGNISGSVGSVSSNVNINSNADITAIKAKTDGLNFTLEGKIDSNILAIEGQLTSGNNATLNLKRLNIINSNGTASLIQSTGGSGAALQVIGPAEASAAEFLGGTDGPSIPGISILGAVGLQVGQLSDAFAAIRLIGKNKTVSLETLNDSSVAFSVEPGGSNSSGIIISKTGTGKKIDADLSGFVDSVTTAVNINSNSDITGIKAKTDLIPAVPATEGTGLAIKAKTDLLPSDPTSETNATANAGAILSAISSIPSGISKADVAAALVDQDISGVVIDENSIYALLKKLKTVLLHPIRWNFAGTIAKLIYRNESDTADEAEANVYKDNGTSKPTNSGQVSTRDNTEFLG